MFRTICFRHRQHSLFTPSISREDLAVEKGERERIVSYVYDMNGDGGGVGAEDGRMGRPLVGRHVEQMEAKTPNG